MNGRNPAPPKKPWNDDSPVNTNKQWFRMVSKWCRNFVHPQYVICPQKHPGGLLSLESNLVCFCGQSHKIGLFAFDLTWGVTLREKRAQFSEYLLWWFKFGNQKDTVAPSSGPASLTHAHRGFTEFREGPTVFGLLRHIRATLGATGMQAGNGFFLVFTSLFFLRWPNLEFPYLLTSGNPELEAWIGGLGI